MSGEKDERSHSFFLYNTFCTIAVLSGKGDALSALNKAVEEAYRVRELLDYFDPASELSRLNNSAGQGFVQVPETLYVYLAELFRMAELSGGSMDPTIGPLMDLWDFTADAPRIPTEAEIRAAMENIGCGKVHFDNAGKRVSLERPEMRIDAGASGKGYAVDKAAERLMLAGVDRAYVNFGGNIRVIGPRSSSGDPWVIGLQKPWGGPGESIGRFHILDESVATSGGYDRYFCIDGVNYSHILDPKTGRPAPETYLSTTVVSKSAWVADVMSTAFFVTGEARGAAMLAELDPGAAYLLVNPDHTFTASEGMANRLI